MDLLLATLTQYGPAFVFGVVLVQQLGAPIPVYPVLVVAGALAARGQMSLAPLFGLAMLATLLADHLWYWAGQRLGRRVLRLLCTISLTPDSCVRQTESIFTRCGPPSLMVAKFVPGFASVATALSGALRIPRGSFLLFDAIGAALWLGVGLALGWVFASAIETALGTVAELGRFGLALLLVALAAFVAAKWWQRHQFQVQLRGERITVADLAGRIDQGEPTVLLDVQTASALPHDRIPGALQMQGQALPPVFDTMARDTLVVVYCACPNEASAVQVATRLRRKGFKRVLPLLGGVDAWAEAGRPLER
ncbi:VTT domain-containing protein [Pseudorhodoferax sp. Leaf267]|uniref:VTT domain-containing protein n=1 Tax=Pseudorhodoferax sp. Leaf267 TaxID=1736316 RepID=UPI0006F622A6|nr:VTT domain-containing protein [Pseudorhodoferax sp. Leaf267]KQP14068.1 sulfurtransferase [Pseudorhodoferax sp. Leaf267]